MTPYSGPFSFYRKLALKIKSSLGCGRKSSPIVKIESPFNKLQYDGGLRAYGKFKCSSRGNEHYTVSQYSDLDDLLGKNWHIKGINSAGDFAYAILQSVDFYLRKKQPLVEFLMVVVEQRNICKQGYTLVFSFIIGDGVQADFARMYA